MDSPVDIALGTGVVTGAGTDMGMAIREAVWTKAAGALAIPAPHADTEMAGREAP